MHALENMIRLIVGVGVRVRVRHAVHNMVTVRVRVRYAIENMVRGVQVGHPKPNPNPP